ncbi:J domain-containing protein [Halorientalis halophila]|uniref:J domain-containing protein n=1 Tax=Halorientalis halophila TaxID=3108499 RepID=UPI00300B1928
MAETFYSVLGVETDADAEAIRDAFRAKVKETHPDVSDDDDAASTFKRLTAARDVLVDETSRRRYDRVGHATYVRRHLDSPAWSADADASDVGTDSRTEAGQSAGGTTTGTTDADEASDSSAGDTSSGDSDGTSGARSTPGDSGSSGSSSRAGPGSANRRGTRGGSTAENYRRYRSDHGETNRTGSGRTGRNATGDHGTWSTDSSRNWAFSGGRTASTATGGHEADPRQRARRENWEAAHAAKNAYTPSGFEPTAESDEAAAAAQRDALRAIGPWLAFHFVFLISAFVTVWLLMTWVPSVPTLFLSLLLLGGTVFFSILHLVSQVYS